MRTLRNIVMASAVVLGSLTYITSADAQETFSEHLDNFGQEISKEMDDSGNLEKSDLVERAQRGDELDEGEMKKVSDFYQHEVGNYVADRLIEALKKSWLGKYVRPVEKVAKGVEIPVLTTGDRVRVKPELDLIDGGRIQVGLNVSHKKFGISAISNGEVRAEVNLFEKGNKRLSLEAGYNEGGFIGVSGGIRY